MWAVRALVLLFVAISATSDYLFRSSDWLLPSRPEHAE